MKNIIFKITDEETGKRLQKAGREKGFKWPSGNEYFKPEEEYYLIFGNEFEAEYGHTMTFIYLDDLNEDYEKSLAETEEEVIEFINSFNKEGEQNDKIN